MNKNKNRIKHSRNTKELLKVIKTKEDGLLFGVYFLKVCYKTILDILETFCGGFFNIPDPNLNSCYLQCLKQVGIILKSQKKIKDTIGEPPKLFESLVGDIEEADQEWKLGYRQAAREYYGKIDNLFVKHGSKNYTLPKFIQEFFDFTDKTITHHKNYDKIYRHLFGVNKKREKIIRLSNLAINLEKAFIQYKKKPPVDISPANKEIVLLLYLIKNTGSVCEYLDIAKLLRLEENYEYLKNKDVARKVQFIRRDLVSILKQAGMTEAEIRNLITTKTKLGYMIRKT